MYYASQRPRNSGWLETMDLITFSMVSNAKNIEAKGFVMCVGMSNSNIYIYITINNTKEEGRKV